MDRRWICGSRTVGWGVAVGVGSANATTLLPQLRAESVLLLSAPLLSAQLLARDGAALAGTDRDAVSKAAGLSGVSPLPRTGLALRNVAIAEILSRTSLLAGPV